MTMASLPAQALTAINFVAGKASAAIKPDKREATKGKAGGHIREPREVRRLR